MIARFAYAYAFVLSALEMLCFSATLLLHLGLFVGARDPCIRYGIPLFRTSVIIGVLATAFVKDPADWMTQVKSAPAWMWKSALSLGVYALFIVLLQIVLVGDHSSSDNSFMVSGFPLGFDAIIICILDPVLWKRYLDNPQLIRRTGTSMIMGALGVLSLLAYRVGYWPPRREGY
jgi:hypothetical protein